MQMLLLGSVPGLPQKKTTFPWMRRGRPLVAQLRQHDHQVYHGKDAQILAVVADLSV